VWDIDNEAISLLTEFCSITEDLALTAYKDPLSADGLPITNGYGSTRNEQGEPWIVGEVISRAEAIALLKRDVTEAYTPCKNIPFWHEMNAYQRAALADLNFNEGYSYKDGDHDSLDAVLGQKAWGLVGRTLQMYDNNDSLGLSRRRFAEWLLFRKNFRPKNAYEQAWAMNSVENILRAIA
jgi:GH24 family phage-related lysozyme (muramidase)